MFRKELPGASTIFVEVLLSFLGASLDQKVFCEVSFHIENIKNQTNYLARNNIQGMCKMYMAILDQ